MYIIKENISLLKRPYKLENNEMKVHLVLVVIFIAQSSGKPVNEVTSQRDEREILSDITYLLPCN